MYTSGNFIYLNLKLKIYQGYPFLKNKSDFDTVFALINNFKKSISKPTYA